MEGEEHDKDARRFCRVRSGRLIHLWQVVILSGPREIAKLARKKFAL